MSSNILEDVGYQEQSKSVLAEFGRCISTQGVRSFTQTFNGGDGRIAAASSPSALAPDGKGRSSVVVVIQDDRQGNCFLAVYSGGSAAAWLITGWTVTQGFAQIVPRLGEYDHTG